MTYASPPPSLQPPKGRSAAATKIASILAALMLLGSACSTGDPDAQPSADNGGGDAGNGTVPNADLSSSDIVLTSGLVTLDSCDALLERLIAEGVERVGPYGLGSDFGHFGEFDEMAEDDMAEETEAMSDAESVDAAMDTDAASTAGEAALQRDGANESAEGDSGFSGTNNQEREVDEADLVKTDGRRLVTVQENQMQVIDVSGDEPSLTKSIPMPEDVWDGELFLNGDTALLMSSGWTEYPFMEGLDESSADSSFLRLPGVPTGRLIQVNLERGEIERTLEFEGSYLSAREIDGTIRIVLTASANRFPFLQPSNRGAEESATEFNRELIENSTIEQWIPTYRITDGPPARGLGDPNIVTEGPLVDCDRVHLPQEFAGFGSVVVMTTDLDDGLDLKDTVAVYTEASTVYASTDRLAVATPRWIEFDDDGRPIDGGDGNYTTSLHTFDISDPDRADYVASGSVIGHLLNQFSMSEYDGNLRVATTAGNPWGGPWEEDGEVSSESFVTVLSEDDGALRPIGQVGGLGEGEQIFAVRFLGDRGYVVTFRQIDPLYTIDLSDPTNPTVEGELKIPGFSNYLHPLGDGLLMGVGMDGDDEGRISGAVVSLFDVADPANPTQLDKLPLVDFPTGFGESEDFFEGDSYTPVNNDARAFTYFDDTAIVPVSWWRYIERPESEFGGEERNGSEAVMIRVEDRSLVEVDRVAHPYLQECEGPNGFTRRFVEVGPDGELSPLDSPATGVTGGLDPDQDSDVDQASDVDQSEDGATEDAEADFVREDEEVEAEILLPDYESEEYCWVHAPEIFRTVVVGDTLYTVAYNGIGVHDFNGGEFRQWIGFESR